ncbi:hypothetical protein BU23DRAFT_554285 [Bimuria novae-zelandiae CBS 107.79]|uniref:Uncharacterized protein n=1 Tax=Bimuria novae-zelandiae CBS 107.79 TaxID=1447943 RepID=A0A6A5V8Y2_9PLEO|nr:hypothetical protein BU23DRAFT_554285 [Bimuria novae-zelandiae CBS 107.79]
MELEFYMFRSDKAAISYPAFLVPASALKTVVSVQGHPSFYIWTMQSLFSVKLLNTLSFAREEATRLLLDPYIQARAFMPPSFVAITTEGVQPETTDLLKQRLKGDYAVGGLLQKLRSLQYSATPGEETNWTQAAGRFRMRRKFAELLWENHRECLRVPSTSFDGIHA